MLGGMFDTSRRRFLKDIACDEVVTGGSFGIRIFDGGLDLGLFERGRGFFKLVGRFQKVGDGVLFFL
jgi:hypothetical protein